MRDEAYTPFNGKSARSKPRSATRLLHQFHKPGHIIEIRERSVTQFEALEFIVFYDGSLHESQMFHGARLPEYPTALEGRCQQLRDGGWIEDPTAKPLVT